MNWMKSLEDFVFHYQFFSNFSHSILTFFNARLHNFYFKILKIGKEFLEFSVCVCVYIYIYIYITLLKAIKISPSIFSQDFILYFKCFDSHIWVPKTYHRKLCEPCVAHKTKRLRTCLKRLIFIDCPCIGFFFFFFFFFVV